MDRRQFPGEELVVVSLPMFEHRCAKGFEDPGGFVLQSVNDQKIKNLEHLVKVLRDVKEKYVKLRFAELGSDVMIFRHKEMDEVTKEIMDENGIPVTKRMSPELMKLWKSKK